MAANRNVDIIYHYLAKERQPEEIAGLTGSTPDEVKQVLEQFHISSSTQKACRGMKMDKFTVRRYMADPARWDNDFGRCLKSEEKEIERRSQISPMGKFIRDDETGKVRFVTAKNRNILWAIAGFTLGIGGIMKGGHLIYTIMGVGFCLAAVTMLFQKK